MLAFWLLILQKKKSLADAFQFISLKILDPYFGKIPRTAASKKVLKLGFSETLGSGDDDYL